jgi:hypothetical protein
LFIEATQISFLGTFLCWGIFLYVPSFAHKKIVDIHLFFDFVKTHMSNDSIGWFSTLKYILKGHAGLWSELEDFHLVFLKVILCNCWKVWNLDLLRAIFVFCLIWLRLQIGTWGGVVGQEAKYPPPQPNFVRQPF